MVNLPPNAGNEPPGPKVGNPLFRVYFDLSRWSFAARYDCTIRAFVGHRLHRILCRSFALSPYSGTTRGGIFQSVRTPGSTLPALVSMVAAETAENRGISPPLFLKQRYYKYLNFANIFVFILPLASLFFRGNLRRGCRCIFFLLVDRSKPNVRKGNEPQQVGEGIKE